MAPKRKGTDKSKGEASQKVQKVQAEASTKKRPLKKETGWDNYHYHCSIHMPIDYAVFCTLGFKLHLI